MKFLTFKWYYVCYLFIFHIVHEKYDISYYGLHDVNVYENELHVDVFRENYLLQEALAEISGTPAILILNSHALNLTLNWLCNVKTFASVHDRLIIFAFDYVAFDAISKLWPKIKVLLWPLPEMDVKFKSGDAHYQVFMYWRANLSAYLASIKRDFWMFQTDTLWRKNIFEVINTDKLLGTNGNLLFDQEGDQGLLDGMVAGGYFFVKGDTRSECFFTEVARQLKNYYATDNNIMTALCAISYCNNHCYFIPISVISNWRWHWSRKEFVPALLQFDGGLSAKFSSTLLKFVNITESTKDFIVAKCITENSEAPQNAISDWSLRTIEQQTIEVQRSIIFFHRIAEWISAMFPPSKYILRVYIIPYYAYYFMQ